MRAETVMFQKNLGENVRDNELDNDFLSRRAKAQPVDEKIKDV